MKPGGCGFFIMLFDKQLARIEGNKPQPKPRSTYDEDMAKKVKLFKSYEGLNPDGFFGNNSIPPDYESRKCGTYA